jgi:hypothetical protein
MTNVSRGNGGDDALFRFGASRGCDARDYGSPEMGRFADSITFSPGHAPDDAIELPAPPK